MGLYDSSGNWKGGGFGLRSRRFAYTSRSSYNLPPILIEESTSHHVSSSSESSSSQSQSSSSISVPPFLWLQPKRLQPDINNAVSFWPSTGSSFAILRQPQVALRPQIIEIAQRCARFQPGRSLSASISGLSSYSFGVTFKAYQSTESLVTVGQDVLSIDNSGNLKLNGTTITSVSTGAVNWHTVLWNSSSWIVDSSSGSHSIPLDPNPNAISLGSNDFLGLIREAITFDSTLSSGDLTTVSGYLGSHVAVATTYYRPDGVSVYYRPDGVSKYHRP